MNFLLFHCHDAGRFFGCYGVPTVTTSHIDRFAADAILFERAFCAAPQCSPSRAAMFTGRYPHCNGVMGLTHAGFAWNLHASERHLAEVFRDNGYYTCGVGIVHECRRSPEEMGFERRGSTESRASEVVDHTIAELETAIATGRPFYLQAGTLEPHRMRSEGRAEQGFVGNHIKPDSSRGVTVPGYLVDDPGARQEVAELQGAVRHLDEQFGRLMEYVEGRGLFENTCVIVVTDHGVALPRAKCSLYEAGLEIALIMRTPFGPRGRRVPDLVSNVDLMPALLDLAGIPHPSNLQGFSFAGLLGRSEFPCRPRETIFAEMTYHTYYDPIRSIRNERFKLIVFFSSAPAFMDPSQSWRPRTLTRTPENPAAGQHPSPPVELYDLVNDPWEQSNLAADGAYAPVRAELLGQLRLHMEQTADPLLAGAIANPMHDLALQLLGK